MNEDRLIARLLKAADPPTEPRLQVGPGDDCAVAPGGLVLKTDCVIESVHYRPDTAPRRIGWKAAARVVSDFAAMGAQPQHALITLAMERDRPDRWATTVYRGIGDCARAFGFTIAGGDTATTPQGSWLSIAMTGKAPKRPLLRSGASSGDLVMVTGRLGGSLQKDRHLKFRPRLEEGRWLAERSDVTAMMDLSDGLAADLPRLARASECGYRIEPGLLPKNRGADDRTAMTDGEDYELLFTVRLDRERRLHAAWRRKFPLPLTTIGLLMPAGTAEGLTGSGYDHRAKL